MSSATTYQLDGIKLQRSLNEIAVSRGVNSVSGIIDEMISSYAELCEGFKQYETEGRLEKLKDALDLYKIAEQAADLGVYLTVRYIDVATGKLVEESYMPPTLIERREDAEETTYKAFKAAEVTTRRSSISLVSKANPEPC